MRSTQYKPGSWLLILAFCIQAILPGTVGGLQLCIGCEGSGFAFETINTPAPVNPTDACCSSNSQSNDSQYTDTQYGDQSINCRCIKVSIDSILFLPPRQSTPRPLATRLLHVAMIERLLTQESFDKGLAPRAPPDAPPLGLVYTLLSQRTSLLI